MFLGLDLGTTNVKAVLSDAAGRVLARGSAGVRLYHEDDRVEQEIEEIWDATLAAIRAAGENAELSAVRAVGVSAQGGALQLLGPQGEPRGRVISWLDGRGDAWNEAITDELGAEWFADHTGHGRSGVAVGQLLRMRDEAPDAIEVPNRIGFVGDVVVERLCGTRAHDPTSLSLPVLLNPQLEEADPQLLARLGIGESQLPRLEAATSPAGGLLREVAERTGLPAGIPVSPAVHDQYAAALGSNAVRAGDVMFGAGTAWVLLAVTDRLHRPVTPDTFVCPHPVAGLYGQLLSLVTGGSAFTWGLRMVGLEDRGAEKIDTLLEDVSPGCDGLRFWPFLVAGGGEGLEAGVRGRFEGLRLAHDKAHVLRSVVEGLALELTRYLRFFTNAGTEVERLIMSGGASASRVTPRVLADCTKVPVTCLSEPDASALGGAMIARAMTETGSDLVRISDEMTPEIRTVEPGEDTETYEQMFREYVRSLPHRK